MSGRQTSIKDVAEAAGVSFKTVSRVLNNEPHVRPELRERVRAAADRLGYAPNVAARELAGGRSLFIGLMFDNPSESYISKAQTGAIARCQQTGHHLVVEPLEPGDDVPHTLDLILSRLRVDGLILTPPVCDNQLVLNAVEEAGVRCVRIAPMNEVERTPFVAIDDAQAAFDISRHLLALGHRDIGFIAGPSQHAASPRRLGGFLRAMHLAGLAVPPDRIQPGDFSFASGMTGAMALLTGGARPTAIFAANDDMALGALSAASQVGLAVPGDLSIAGFDDSEAALMAWPELTTIRQPIAEMSAAAADMLIGAPGKAPDWPVPDRWLGYELIIRGSTGRPPS